MPFLNPRKGLIVEIGKSLIKLDELNGFPKQLRRAAADKVWPILEEAKSTQTISFLQLGQPSLHADGLRRFKANKQLSEMTSSDLADRNLVEQFPPRTPIVCEKTGKPLYMNEHIPNSEKKSIRPGSGFLLSEFSKKVSCEATSLKIDVSVKSFSDGKSLVKGLLEFLSEYELMRSPKEKGPTVVVEWDYIGHWLSLKSSLKLRHYKLRCLQQSFGRNPLLNCIRTLNSQTLAVFCQVQQGEMTLVAKSRQSS